MGFFPDSTRETTYPTGSNSGGGSVLQSAVEGLKPSTRKAIYAVATSDKFEQETWNGCVFNKVTGLHDTVSVAEALGEPNKAISSFIVIWDALEPSTANKILRETLEKVGFNVPTGTGKRTRIVKYYAFKSADTKFQEELAKIVDLGDIEELKNIDLTPIDIEAASKVLCNA